VPRSDSGSGSRLELLLPTRSQAFMAAIAAAPIDCDPETHSRVFVQTLEVARRYSLSAYDASYLELNSPSAATSRWRRSARTSSRQPGEPA
jgi:ferric-dicitrate binding protein FerR (iron transport regulator)